MKLTIVASLDMPSPGDDTTPCLSVLQVKTGSFLFFEEIFLENDATIDEQ